MDFDIKQARALVKASCVGSCECQGCKALRMLDAACDALEERERLLAIPPNRLEEMRAIAVSAQTRQRHRLQFQP